MDALLNQLNDLPVRLRTYSSYEHVKRVLKTYTRVNVLVVELKSEAVKERHWKRLQRQLRVSWVLPDLTLGQLWDVDLIKNEMIIKDVLLVAQGEMALEEFLKQVQRTCFRVHLTYAMCLVVIFADNIEYRAIDFLLTL